MSATVRNTCTNCSQPFNSTRRRTTCPRCTDAKHVAKQTKAGETCTGCGRPPSAGSPLRGTKKYGANYCRTCLNRKSRGLSLGLEYIQIPGNPAVERTTAVSPETTEANRRALAYWLANNYRTRERQTA